jgi:putative ABC transport system permease protein
MVNGQDVTGQNFSMPISVIGINGLDNLSALNVTSFTLSSGEKIDPTSSENVAMLGQSIASENNISVGSTFTAYDQTITVKGIFDAGNTFANSEIVMPLATVQNLSGETDQVNSIIATTSSIDTVSSVKDAITNKLGSSSVDVTSQQDQSNEAIAPLENIKTISLYSLIGSTVAGAVILFLTMVMIVRERRREIGVLKAIGASNLLVTSQFMVESLVLTVISSGIGIIAGTLFSNPVLKILVSNNESSTGGGARFSGGGGGAAMMRFGAGIADSAQGALRNLQANVGLDIILYGIGAAVVIAIIGSAIPSFIIAKIRPAEVMRAE